eukprot:TRINITY_DN6690_c0_g1_i1.p1 TRINITY_DN6690_c0_g1~~TRINITY_DN6690_c0_g1_i1.p1  ORF type:complete len:244 (-),score=4.47 TRINITY_DN6690_c0_g1_i1:162-893(-)
MSKRIRSTEESAHNYCNAEAAPEMTNGIIGRWLAQFEGFDPEKQRDALTALLRRYALDEHGDVVQATAADADLASGQRIDRLQPTDSWAQLPAEILAMIVSNVHNPRHLASMSLTCTWWHRTVWASASCVMVNRADLSNPFRKFKSLVSLESFSLQGVDMAAFDFAPFRGLSRLTRVELDDVTCLRAAWPISSRYASLCSPERISSRTGCDSYSTCRSWCLTPSSLSRLNQSKLCRCYQHWSS